MRLACCLLTFAALSAAASQPALRTGTVLEASLSGHALILNGIFLNGSGPFRMLLDTGNATSIVRPELARRLHLQPAFAVDQVTATGARRVPVAILDEVRAGAVTDRSLEAIIGDVFQSGVDGVLGESWLVRHDYLLDYRARRFVLDGPPPAAGVRLPLHSTDGRPVVDAFIDRRPTELVIDSGASTLVLYGQRPGAMVQLVSNGGSATARKSPVRFSLPGERERTVDAVSIDLSGPGPGLLPAAAFASVFVSNREGFVEFSRQSW